MENNTEMMSRQVSRYLENNLTRRDFPADFLWGAATSCYQIEGAYKEGCKSFSNWDAFTLQRPDKIHGGSNGCLAINHYNRYKEDVALMKKLGLNTYRFSLSWSRILPGGHLSAGINREGIDFYNDLIDLLIAEGIEPCVTLFHFDFPQCLQEEYGGFLSPLILKDFAEYVEVCFFEFGDRVKMWITENEPWAFTAGGYILGAFPPGHGTPHPLYKSEDDDDQNKSCQYKTTSSADLFDNIPRPAAPFVMPRVALGIDPAAVYGCADAGTYGAAAAEMSDDGDDNNPDATEPYIVAHHLILAHAKAVEIYRKHFQAVQGGKIGVTNMTTWYEPYSLSQPDIEAASRAVDFMWGWFVEPVVTGYYPKVMRDRVGDRLPEFTPEQREMVKGSYDFIGMNYYTTYWASYKPNPPWVKPNYYNDQEVAFRTERNGVKIGKQAGSAWLFVVPRGIYELLMHTKIKYNDPIIYITENGVDEKNDPKKTMSEARHDPDRISYHMEHLAYMRLAMDRGVKLKGYYPWALLDNFEWTEGYSVRFGFYFVDYTNNLIRCPKDSAIWYMNFLNNKILPPRNNREAAAEDIAASASASGTVAKKRKGSM
ncbi:beta-glucosidase 24-like [Andrographis paniculata]|uniref:beta-glucosidase 24-like n=1 Tax=Andrographis paniculata TaxID=175694 RepID=UPI0021E72007|nr:beta-glucosidase 24-like [Andrographis paniculata]